MNEPDYAKLEAKIETDTIAAIKELVTGVMMFGSANGSVTAFEHKIQEAIDKWLTIREEGRANQ